MKIDSGQFCQLSTSDSFIRWLYETDEPLYMDLVTHLREGRGCGANREKMKQILTTILEGPNKGKLEDFLRNHYPGIIKGEVVDHTPPDFDFNTLNVHGVFEHYDPTLNAFPRRLIITDADVGHAHLSKAVDDFCAQQAHCEFVYLDVRAYIEYLPPEHAGFKDKVPERNWAVVRYRHRHRR